MSDGQRPEPREERIPTVTRRQIEDALRAAGLDRGDLVMLHSSLSSMGHVEGGADAVIDAFLDVLGPEGTLMVPTFGSDAANPWEASTVPSGTGRITETLRQRPDAVRSIQPSHSVAAIGQHAKALTDGHIDVEALGIHSPLDKLALAGGHVFLLGVGHDANTMIHLGEARAESPYLHVPKRPDAPVRMSNGSVVMKAYVECPGCSADFAKVERPMREADLIIDVRIGNARCQLMNAQALVDTVVAMIHQQPDAVLCDRPDCWSCVARRGVLQQEQ